MSWRKVAAERNVYNELCKNWHYADVERKVKYG